MPTTITSVSEEDQDQVMDIFNHYIEHSFAAFPDTPLPREAFALFLNMTKGYPFLAARDDTHLLGFAMLRPYNPIPTFAHTAEVSYFLSPDHTGDGIGSALLKNLEERGKEKGIRNLIATVSSVNTRSIRFHLQHGFSECGRLHHVCRKMETSVDVVILEKELT
jgi:L-amino acid N-acyltransferase YncA